MKFTYRLFSFFRRKPKVEEQPVPEEETDDFEFPPNRVTFYIDENYELGIKIDWKDNAQVNAIGIGKLLYFINSGQLSSLCVQILGHHATANPEDTIFVKRIIESWEDSYAQYDQYMRPSDVFAKLKITQGNTE